MNGYRLGCPTWGSPRWRGGLLTSRAAPSDQLSQYARVFDAVECHRDPSPADAVASWIAATPGTFRFAPVLPRALSHDRALDVPAEEVAAFLLHLVPLGPRLGPLLVRLPRFVEDMAALQQFLGRIPTEVAIAVEPEHPRLSDQGDGEAAFDAVLEARGADRVFSAAAALSLDELLQPRRRRPTSHPGRARALGPHPVVRLMGSADPARDREALSGWAERVDAWISEGREPYVFAHHPPDDSRAPDLARAFHQLLRERRPSLPPLAPWPGELEPRQLGLFDELE